jgi:hypothetical protein
MAGAAAQLDLDDNTDATFLATFDAIHNCIIEDHLGNRYQNVVSESSSIGPPAIIGPKGVSDAALMDILYQLHFCFYTMLAQADADDWTTSAYVASMWTGKIVHRFINRFGTMTGLGSVYYFRPGGVTDQKQLVEALYNFLYYWIAFLTQTDADAKPAGVTYLSLWGTTIKVRIENAAGSVIGATSTHLG